MKRTKFETIARVERKSLSLENKGFICSTIILVAEKLYIKYKELKVNMLYRYGGDAPYE